MKDNGDSRRELMRRADEVRFKLLCTVEQLDRRRHELFDLRQQLERHAAQLVGAAGLLLAATLGVVAVVAHRIATAAERRRRRRWHLARAMWRHPDRMIRAQRRSLFGETMRSVLLILASAAVSVPARRAAAAMALERRRPEPNAH
jgi:hypothetical protein